MDSKERSFFDVKVCFPPPFGFQVYAVCTSVKELCTRIPRMTGEEKEFETIERGWRKHTSCWSIQRFNSDSDVLDFFEGIALYRTS